MLHPAVLDASDLDGIIGFRINGLSPFGCFGYGVGSAGDVKDDGIADLLLVASKRVVGSSATSTAYVVLGGQAFGAHQKVSALDGWTFRDAGKDIHRAGDVNGDGIDDIIIADGAGRSHVVFGRQGGHNDLSASALDGLNGFTIQGAPTDLVGSAVAGAGDVNGDGIGDLVIGARGARGIGGADSGAAYVVFGAAAGFGSTLDLSALDGTKGFRIESATAGAQMGHCVAAAGDLNGDGFGDVVIGAPTDDGAGLAAGAVHVVFGRDGRFPASVDAASLNGRNGFTIRGPVVSDRLGWAVAPAGDVNGDGLSDLVISAADADPRGNREGSTFVVFGTTAGFGASLDLDDLDGTNGFRIDGVAPEGQHLAVSTGDFNGDGRADIAIGSPDATPYGNVGEENAYVIYGADAFPAFLDVSMLDGTNGFRFNGGTGVDDVGRAVGSPT